jgi:hypothetical protein
VTLMVTAAAGGTSSSSINGRVCGSVATGDQTGAPGFGREGSHTSFAAALNRRRVTRSR